jgi:mannosyltransferase OCH1-like enzyme
MIVNKKEQNIKRLKQLEAEKQQIKDEIKLKIENNNKILNYNRLNKPFILKPSYNAIIPLHLYTCWHTKELPPLMKENYDYLVESNPKITFHLYDDNDCREFIKNNFEADVLGAYDSLIPCAFKCDLWRYCILFINGGIYMDIKYRCVNGFKFIDLTEKEYFVRDCDINNVYNALIVSLPGNEILHKCIRKIVENVQNKYYGNGCLDPTGPGLLAKYFTQEEKQNIKIYHSLVESINKYYIVKDDRIILSWYDGYREEQSKFQKYKHYSQLWEERNIYM